MRGTDYEGLLEVYALLVFIVGENCTNENIHDAWSVWQNRTEPTHRSLIPFNELTKEVQDLDEPYCQAVIKVVGMLHASKEYCAECDRCKCDLPVHECGRIYKSAFVDII